MKKGFTLIELLVVVLIIGILAAIAVPQYQKAVAKAHAVEAITFIKSLKPAIDEYVLVNNKCPTTFDELSLVAPGKSSRFEKDRDKMIAEYYSPILSKDCRLDIGYNNSNGLEPAFLYQFGKSKIFSAFEEGQIYCYYITDEPNADKREQICKSLSKSERIKYSSYGYAYKM